MPDSAFRRLYEETAKMAWQPADEVRHRGQRRTAHHRVAVAAGAFLAVVLLAGGAVALAGRPTGAPSGPGSATPTFAPSTSPSPATNPAPPSITTVPPAAMLRPIDAGTGTWEDTLTSGDWKVEFTLSLCDTGPGNATAPVSAVDTRDQHLLRAADGHSVQQSVTAYRSTDADTAFVQLRDQVLACARIDNALSGGVITMKILTTSFAGDASMLVETTSSGHHQVNAIVREAGLISQIAVSPIDEGAVTTLARRAVDRMCPITQTC